MTEPHQKVSRRRRVAAVLLSFLPGPGSGHLLLGRWRRALLWLAVVCVAQGAALLTRFAGPPLSVVLILAAAVDVARVRPAAWSVSRPWLAALCVLPFWLASLGAALVLRWFVEPFMVPSASMEPTLLHGDQFMVDHLRAPPGSRRGLERGDVVILHRPEEPRPTYVKRVVALGGDTVALRGGQLSLNGEPLGREGLGACGAFEFSTRMADGCEVFEETLGAHRYHVVHDARLGGGLDVPGRDGCPRGMEPREEGCAVPPGFVFVLGDNRPDSMDSRHWGPVPASAVGGVARFIHFSLGEGFTVRWGRLGQRVE